MVTFVNPAKIKDGLVPGRVVGRCFIEAGFRFVGKTKGGLHAFQMQPQDMPAPRSPKEAA
jgi:hypothetical protein